MKRYIFILGFVALLIAFSPFIKQIKSVSAKNEKEIIKCITQYGWKTDGILIDSAIYKLPNPLSKVYEEYNNIQLQSGFDISRYCDKTITRYTYRILNHKNSNDGIVYCNILVYNDKMIAADIMTTAIGGFMHGINNTVHIE